MKIEESEFIVEDNYFIIDRASQSPEEQPCKEAFRAKMIKTDYRTTFNTDKFDNWFKLGTNHREWTEGICRDMGYETIWVIEINDIMEFIGEHGDCIIGYDLSGFKQITIYDGYIE